jgi:hypothetical protein
MSLHRFLGLPEMPAFRLALNRLTLSNRHMTRNGLGHSNCSGWSGGNVGYVPGSRNLLYTQLHP